MAKFQCSYDINNVNAWETLLYIVNNNNTDKNKNAIEKKYNVETKKHDLVYKIKNT